MAWLTLEDAMEVLKNCGCFNEAYLEYIKQELEQKCWIADKGSNYVRHMNKLIHDINPAEICSHVEQDNLSGWCAAIKVEMDLTLAHLERGDTK